MQKKTQEPYAYFSKVLSYLIYIENHVTISIDFNYIPDAFTKKSQKKKNVFHTTVYYLLLGQDYGDCCIEFLKNDR